MFITHSIHTSVRRTAAVIASSALLLGAGAAAPSVSHATDGTSTSAYFCSYGTPWLLYSRLAGYKCFQYSNGSGLSSPAIRAY